MRVMHANDSCAHQDRRHHCRSELRDPDLEFPALAFWRALKPVDVASVDRIIYAISNRFDEDWKNHTLQLFTQAG
jgi:hypothetical protein